MVYGHKAYSSIKRFSTCALLSICGVGSSYADTTQFQHDSKSKNVLHFYGDITPATAKEMAAYLDEGIDTVIVTSGGGDGAAGLSIGKGFRQRHITVIVEKYCFSSCANYLFIGAVKKRLEPGAILGFHGGLTGSTPPQLNAADYPLLSTAELNSVQQQLQTLYAEETTFFNSIGFDPALFKRSMALTKLSAPSHTIEVEVDGGVTQFPFDQQDQAKHFIAKLNADHKSYNYRVNSGDESPSKFYFPSLATMRHHGVDGILSYPYPDNVQEMEAMRSSLSIIESAELELVGDL
jgi:hypothetical protein